MVAADGIVSSQHIRHLISALETHRISFSVAKQTFEVIFLLTLGNEYARTHIECVEALQNISHAYRPKYLKAETELLAIVYLQFSPANYRIVGQLHAVYGCLPDGVFDHCCQHLRAIPNLGVSRNESNPLEVIF